MARIWNEMLTRGAFVRSARAPAQLFSLLSPGVVAKTLPRNKLGDCLSKNIREPNINVVRSVWRRLKENIKEAIIRDLQPVKDVKGGGGVKGESKPTTGGTSTTRRH
jgi:hypothetical protein